MKKIFLYCPSKTQIGIVKKFYDTGYECYGLTNKIDDFWRNLELLEKHGTLILPSNKDANRPLLIKENLDHDTSFQDIQRLASTLTKKDVQLYFLPCHTGVETFAPMITISPVSLEIWARPICSLSGP